MKYIHSLIILSLLLLSCSKQNDDFVWERNMGNGFASFITATPDSGFLSCGQVDGTPFLVRLARDRSKMTEFKKEQTGTFTSAWCDTSRIITAGNINGKMHISCIRNNGELIWDTTLVSTYVVNNSIMLHTGSDEFVDVGSESSDSVISGPTGLLFLKFDSTGNISYRKDITETAFLAANDISCDRNGNFYLPLTRKTGSAKMKASVAKFNNSFQKIWETDLYNNPDFGAVPTSVVNDDSGNLYLTGKTELSTQAGTVDNTFITSLSSAGTVRWKKYLEQSNTGMSLVLFNNELMVLNKNCFFINKADPADGADGGRFNMFSSCDQKNTSAFGAGIDIDYQGNILLAGSKGGSYYLAVKTLQ